MEKTSITSLRLAENQVNLFLRNSLSLLITFLTLFSSSSLLQAQCSLACNGKIQVSLDQTCQALITPAMVINDTLNACPGGQYIVRVLSYKKPIPTSPWVTENEIGKTLQVEITETGSGNKCWGDLVVEDKLPPIILCKNDTVPCFYASRNKPVVTDNCTLILGRNDTLILLDERIEPILCDLNYIKRIVRTWKARDFYGNETLPCKDTVLLKRFDTSKVICPLDRTIFNLNPISCKDIYYNRIQLDAKGHPHPNVTGVPQYRDTVSKNPVVTETIKLWPVLDIYCNIAVTYEDIDLGIIGCVHKIMRMWSIREWYCGTERVRICIQLLEIVDNEAPYLHCPYNSEVTTDGNYKCEATVTLSPAIVFDSCGSPVKVDIEYPGGFLKNSNGGTIKLPVGDNVITYIAYDNCYNSTTCTTIVSVLDKTAPVVVCDRETVVSLSLDGRAHVYAKTFDDGSYDDCHIDSFLVRRMFDGPCDNDLVQDPFLPYVEFCCADVGQKIMVVFRAKDKHGNYNDCMVEVEVQDKIKPICKAPADITIGCDVHVDLNNLDVFGKVIPNTTQPTGYNTIIFWGPNHDSVRLTIHNGYAYDNCSLEVSYWAVDNRTQCNVGTVVRYWEVRDKNGADTCRQVITIENYHPFDFNDLVWPRDTTLDGCINPATLTVDRFGRPRGINEDKCDLLGFSYEDQVFHFVNGSDACFKLIRTWKAIDWCQFVYNSSTRRYDYYLATHQQIIKVHNIIDPNFIGSFADTTFCTLDSCLSGYAGLTVNLNDDCTPANELSWEYHIDLDRDGRYEIFKTGIGGVIDASGRYKLGKHRIKYVVEDKCGNKIARERDFTILNCKPPTPYCLVGVAIDLMPMDTNGDGKVDTAMICVWASDVDKGSYHPCGNRVVLSFSKDTANKSKCFNCADLGQQNVELWVTDALTGLSSFCNTFIEIQDNNNACKRGNLTGSVSGLVSFNGNDPLGKAEVTLNGSSVPKQTTASNGTYAFLNMPFNQTQKYSVQALRNDSPLEGVSTADIVKIQKHILGKEELKNPYNIIAADVNNSKSVTTADISELRKLILGQINNFSNNTSWIFVDKAYQFIDNDESILKESYPKEVVINPFTQSMVANLQGIKVGDVNGSFTGLTGTTVRSREVMNLVTDDIQFNLNEEITVPVAMASNKSVSGYQFTLQFDPKQLELIDLIGGITNVSKENTGWKSVENGMVTFSWNPTGSDLGSDVVSILSNQVLFTLKFKALSTGRLSNSLQINSNITKAEAYNESIDEMEIGLGFRTSSSLNINSFVLYQNQPNPFSEKTRIGFDMPRSAKATLAIYDLNSRLIYKTIVDAVKGYNSVDINHSQLGVTGVLYYQLDALGSTETRRMVVIK
ncbi:MAG: cohesin domain-containing protein [Saprospiraceae bacterium]